MEVTAQSAEGRSTPSHIGFGFKGVLSAHDYGHRPSLREYRVYQVQGVSCLKMSPWSHFLLNF
jgi:hypothetical protein